VPRHPLIWTEREPTGDLLAQFAAYTDPEHPKGAVWVSRGGEIPPWPGMGHMYNFAAGFLWTDPERAELLRADPSEEMLSQILGYVESKAEALTGSLPAEPLVVQARDANDGVVIEMLSSVGRFREAAIRAGTHGKVHIMTMSACLNRRQRLIAEEVRAAAARSSAGQRSG
jgi:hypothetical protein